MWVRGIADMLNAEGLDAPGLMRAAGIDPAALDAKWLPYRYLLSPTLDRHALDAAYLGDQLQQRIADLASPAASLLKPLLPRDPTLETLALAEQGLRRRARRDAYGLDETQFLRPLQEFVARGITPAEELLQKFNGPWRGSVDPIFQEYAY